MKRRNEKKRRGEEEEEKKDNNNKKKLDIAPPLPDYSAKNWKRKEKKKSKKN